MAEARWRATIIYRTDKIATSSAQTHEMRELDELQEIVERGPHFDTVIEIRVTKINPAPGFEFLTIEQAAKL